MRARISRRSAQPMRRPAIDSAPWLSMPCTSFRIRGRVCSWSAFATTCRPSRLGRVCPTHQSPWQPRGLLNAFDRLPPKIKEKWIWWSLPTPAKRDVVFSDLIEDNPIGVEWHTAAETAKLLRMMSDINREKLDEAKASGRRMIGTVYKRTRLDEFGRKVQRAEIRFDDIAGCLRTPAGGSSRQVIVVVEGNKVRSRLISPRETARLMGLPDNYESADELQRSLSPDGRRRRRAGRAPPGGAHIRALAHPKAGTRQGGGMSVIPCQQNEELQTKIRDYSEVLKTQAHRLGSHGLDEQEFYNSGVFRGQSSGYAGSFRRRCATSASCPSRPELHAGRKIHSANGTSRAAKIAMTTRSRCRAAERPSSS